MKNQAKYLKQLHIYVWERYSCHAEEGTQMRMRIYLYNGTVQLCIDLSVSEWRSCSFYFFKTRMQRVLVSRRRH